MRFGTTLGITTAFHCSAETRGFPIPQNISKLSALHIQGLLRVGGECRKEERAGEALNERGRATSACLSYLLPMAGLEGRQGERRQRIPAEEGC